MTRRTLLTKEQIKEVESTQRDLRSGKTKLLTDKQVAAMWKSLLSTKSPKKKSMSSVSIMADRSARE